jgi:hypothetical protein
MRQCIYGRLERVGEFPRRATHQTNYSIKFIPTNMTLLHRLIPFLTLTCSSTFAQDAASNGSIHFKGVEGPGKGKHIVLLAGDEEYRSEEALPQMAKILSTHHGFDTTVCFSVNETGEIDPDATASITNSAALEKADAILMSLRMRKWPDEDMQRFEKAFQAGKPIVALRTSTHCFNHDKNGPWGKYTWNAPHGGFGEKVFGETWVSHWGKHKGQATGGVIEEAQKGHAILRGVSGVWGDTDVYEVHLPADCQILMRGAVLDGMAQDSKPIEGKKNDPMMPIAWTREFKNESGNTNQLFVTTMGSATDLTNEGLRRMVVNGVFWSLKMEVPEKTNVDLVGEYKPTPYGFKIAKKGLKPADYAK